MRGEFCTLYWKCLVTVCIIFHLTTVSRYCHIFIPSPQCHKPTKISFICGESVWSINWLIKQLCNFYDWRLTIFLLFVLKENNVFNVIHFPKQCLQELPKEWGEAPQNTSYSDRCFGHSHSHENKVTSI